TKRRPSGAKAIPSGSDRPLATRVLVKPDGRFWENSSTACGSVGGVQLARGMARTVTKDRAQACAVRPYVKATSCLFFKARGASALGGAGTTGPECGRG